MTAGGCRYLPESTVERAREGNPIEKAKLEKDGTTAFSSVYEFASAIRAGTLDWYDPMFSFSQKVEDMAIQLGCVQFVLGQKPANASMHLFINYRIKF